MKPITEKKIETVQCMRVNGAYPCPHSNKKNCKGFTNNKSLILVQYNSFPQKHILSRPMFMSKHIITTVIIAASVGFHE